MKAKDIMTTNLITVKKDYTITRMIKILQDNNITGAPVVDGQDNLIGIVSIKDIIQAVSDLIKVHLSVEKIKEMRGKYNWVEGIMSTDVITADVNEEVLDIFKTMVDRHVHRIPILENGKMVGIISTSDAHKAIIKYMKEKE